MLIREISERKQAEWVEHRANILYHEITKQSSDGISLADIEGNYVAVNPAFCKMCGYSEAELLAMNVRDLVPRGSELVLFPKVLKGERYQIEAELLRKDGSIFIVEINGCALNFGDQKLILGTMRDITVRKGAEKALIESEAKFSKAFQSAPLLMTISSIEDGRYLDVNDAFIRVTGYAREVAIGSTSVGIGLIAQKDRERIKQELISKGYIHAMELELKKADGSRLSCLYSGELINVQGQQRVLSLAIDVTARKQAEDNLRESEERYRKLFEVESDAIIVFDAQTRQFVDVNPAAVKLYGYSHDEFLNLKYCDITEEPKASGETIMRILMGEKSELIPLRWHRKKDGSTFPVEISLSKFVLDGHTVLCSIIRDITSRRQMEMRRIEQHERLQRLAAELARAQDDEQRRIAEGLHEDVAQELALCRFKLVLAGREEDPALADAILKQVDELILETLEKVRSLSFELSSSTLYDLGLKEALLELCDNMYKRYGVDFRIKGGDNLTKINDTLATVLFKAVRELLFNVVKHAGVKEAAIIIQNESKRLKLVVEDQGEGFHDLDDDNAGNLGQGLGLFGIRQRLRDLGGKMQISSIPGEQTRVTIEVPFG